tara:strand:+ start:47686 stop:48540 length:855 start_codon:yes stop_codon:yes gene_type:complete
MKPVKRPIVVQLFRTFPEYFKTIQSAARYCQNIYVPKSKKWMYPLSGKAGSTFMLNLLYEMEFGHPFTAQLKTSANQHSGFAIFQLANAGVFSRLIDLDIGLEEFQSLAATRIATVRNPYTRALSSFKYLCRSHVAGDQRFFSERARLSALTSFDWNLDPNTELGFYLFLKYVFAIQQLNDPVLVDAHWLPLVDHIQPEILKPTLVGKVEHFSAFAKDVAKHLGKSLDENRYEALPKNTLNNNIANKEMMERPEYYSLRNIGLIQGIYSADFEAFEYSLEIPEN